MHLFRRALLLLLTFALGGACGAFTYRARVLRPAVVSPYRPHPAGLDLYLLLGQSNMSGRGELPATPAPLPNTWLFGNDDRWRLAVEPLDCPIGQTDAISADPYPGVGPGSGFARELQRRRPGPVGLVPGAKGGSTLALWARNLRSDTLYGSLLRRARAASLAGRVAGVLIYLGESDTHPPQPGQLRADRWRERFEHLITDLRGDLRDPMLPVVYARIGRTTDPTLTAWTLIRTEQSAVRLPSVAMVDASDAELADSVHLSARGAETVGERMARAMAGLR